VHIAHETTITTSTNTSIFAGTYLEVIRLGKPRKNELCFVDESLDVEMKLVDEKRITEA